MLCYDSQVVQVAMDEQPIMLCFGPVLQLHLQIWCNRNSIDELRTLTTDGLDQHTSAASEKCVLETMTRDRVK